MHAEQLKDIFEDPNNSPFINKFAGVKHKRSSRPDLHALMLIDSLLPNITSDIISAADHDVIYLGVDIKQLAEVITEEQIKELIRCGVCYNSMEDCLLLFT